VPADCHAGYFRIAAWTYISIGVVRPGVCQQILVHSVFVILVNKDIGLLGIGTAIGFLEIFCCSRTDTGILGPGIRDYESRLYNAVDNNSLVFVFARVAFYIIQLHIGASPVNGNREGKGRGNPGAALAGGVDAEVVGSLGQSSVGGSIGQTVLPILPVLHGFRQFVKIQFPLIAFFIRGVIRPYVFLYLGPAADSLVEFVGIGYLVFGRIIVIGKDKTANRTADIGICPPPCIVEIRSGRDSAFPVLIRLLVSRIPDKAAFHALVVLFPVHFRGTDALGVGRLHPQGKGPALAGNDLVNKGVIPVFVQLDERIVNRNVFPVFVLTGYVFVAAALAFSGIPAVGTVNIFQFVQFQHRVFLGLAEEDQNIRVFLFKIIIRAFKIHPVAGIIGCRMDFVAALGPDLKSVKIA